MHTQISDQLAVEMIVFVRQWRLDTVNKHRITHAVG